ncbi:MAG: hypothetical protein GX649_10135 [Chloroflexi bacterium]|nr:hypothetical protein [Chloroflexota bacterium]
MGKETVFAPQTTVALDGARVLVNGQPTYAGRPGVEGLLFNVRTVNATFDDTLNRMGWWDDDGTHPENDHAGYGPWRSAESAAANTARFIAALPEYRAWGILAVNLSFQGGHPLQGKTWIAEGKGSAGARPNGQRDWIHNSGFRADGSLDPDHARRITSVIEACDRLGMVVILQCFYFGQDTVFRDEDAIRRAVDEAVDLVCGRGYTNVIIEIANEVMLGHYHHEILKPARVAELIERARRGAIERHGRRLPVSTSEAALNNRKQWTEEEIDRVFSASDCVFIHGGDGIDHGAVGDLTLVARKIHDLRARPWYRERPRPIIGNEFNVRATVEAAVSRGVSAGLHSTPYLQTMWPPKWGVWENEALWFFRRVRELTGAAGTDPYHREG